MAKIRAVPTKYISGLKESTAAKRKAEIRKRVKGNVSEKDLYKPLSGDSTGKTKPSKYTLSLSDLRKDIAEEAGKMDGTQTERFLKATSKITGIPKRILEEVYNRGLKAWTVGHRPNATPAQWARARIYSFLSGGKTTTTGDADLYKEAKEIKKGKSGYRLK